MRLLAGALVLGIGGFGHSSHGYGESWWREYRSDEHTTLLLHFGPRQVTEDQTLAQKVKAKHEAEQVDLDIEAFDETALPMEGVEMLDPEEELAKQQLQPVDESEFPEDAILDYSDNRRVSETTPEGLRIVPNGKFGKGLSA